MNPDLPRSLERIAVLTNHPVSVPLLKFVGSHVPSLSVAVMTEEDLLRGALELEKTPMPIHTLGADPRGWQEAMRDWLRVFRPDALWVLSFPARLPLDILNLPRAGCWNFHLGRLPGYRGADPVFWQIRKGESSGALCVHRMEVSMDTGPLFRCYPVPLGPMANYGAHLRDLGMAARRAGEDLIGEWNPAGYRNLKAQDSAMARSWPRPKLADQVIRWEAMRSEEVHALVRACNPLYGGAKVACGGEVLQVFASSIRSGSTNKPPGRVLAVSREAITTSCAGGSSLDIHTVGTADGLFHAPHWADRRNLKPGSILA